MRSRGPCSTLLISLLMLSALFSVMIPVTATTPVSGTISTNVDWSGDILLTDDVYVEHGVTLNLKPGTMVNAAEYSITINGTLTATDSDLLSTLSSDSGNHTSTIGMWTGVIINIGGSATLTNVNISNAKTALNIQGSATLSDVSVSDSIIGVEVDGTGTIDDLSCASINLECLLVKGAADVDGVVANSVGSGLVSTGDMDAVNIEVSDAGVGMSITSESNDYSALTISDTNTALVVRGVTTASVDDLSGTGIQLLLDSGDSSGFVLSNVSADANRAVRAEGSDSLEIKDSSFNGSRDGNSMIDVSTTGTFSMSDVELTNASTALDLRGSGMHTIDSVVAEAEDVVLSATGTGAVSLSNFAATAEGQGIRVSGATLDAEGIDISGGLDTTIGIRLATGEHSLEDVVLSRQYSAADTTSLGIELVWATLLCQDITIEDYANGVRAYRSSMDCDNLEISNGRDTGLEIEGSAVSVYGVLSTSLHDIGANLIDSSTLHAESWQSNLHDDVSNIDGGSTATIRFLEAGNTAGFDAIGDGTLVWGSNVTPTLAVSNSHQLIETSIKTVDLSGDPLAAEVQVEGFTFSTGASGIVTIPLRSTGSLVVATSGSAGAQATLIGGTSDQELALPAIPEGDWTITSGNHVVLGPSIGGEWHTVNGNLTIETGASLLLQGTALEPTFLEMSGNDRTFTTLGTGQLIGDGGALINAEMNVDTQSPFTGQGNGLFIDSDVVWNCSSSSDITLVHFLSNLSLGEDCDVTSTSGTIASDPQLGNGASLLLRSVLSIVVLDKGDPVVGASLAIDGESFSSDVNGRVVYTSDAREITESGSTWGGSKTVIMQSNGLMDMMMWDTNSTLSKTFIASTVDSGVQDDWVILESAWSPYYLADDLTISETATLTLNDNAQLVVADDVSITLEGTITAGAGTIQSSGATPWNGITLEGVQAKLHLASTHILGALLPVKVNGGEVLSENGTFVSGTDGLISATYSGSSVSITLIDSELRYGGQNCIRVAGAGVELNIQDTTLSECGDYGLWATLATLDINGLTVEGGSQTGVTLADVEGSISNLDAASHNGTNSSLELSQQDEKLSMRNLILSPAAKLWDCSFGGNAITFSEINDGFANCPNGEDETKMSTSDPSVETHSFECDSGDSVAITLVNDGAPDCIDSSDEPMGDTDAAMVVSQSRWIDLVGLEVSGAPALEIDYSAGQLSELNLTGGAHGWSPGTAISVEHNRGSAALTISDSEISGYFYGIFLMGSAGDEFNHPVESTNNVINSDTAIFCYDLPFVSTDDVLSGSVSCSSENEIESKLVNSVFTSIEATWGAEIVAWEEYSISMMMFGTAIDASASITVDNPAWWTSTYTFSNQGSEWDILLPVFVAGNNESYDLQTAQLSASGPGSLPFTSSIDLSSGSARELTFTLIGNTEPSAHIASPDADQKYSVLTNVSFEGVASDTQSSDEALTHRWEVQDSIGDVIWNSNEASPTWEDLEVGDYLVRYTVTDEHGMSSSDSVSFVVTYHDSDGDWVSTCDEEHWFDTTTGNKCGHDLVDDDDDNDGIIDTLDIWPLDPCADTDVDNDLLPDEVDCPAGVTTDLIEDSDVKRLTTKSSDPEEGANMGMLVAFMLLIVGVLLVVNRMRAADD